MSNASQSPATSSAWVDHISVIWCEPQAHRPTRQLIIHLPGLSLTKESMISYLQDLAARVCRAQFRSVATRRARHRDAARDSDARLRKLSAVHVANPRADYA
jgi:hypothetical protein